VNRLFSGAIRWQRAGHCLLGVLLADFLQSGRIVNDGLYSARLNLPGEVERSNRPDLRADGVIILMTVSDREADLELAAKCLSRKPGRSLAHPGFGTLHFHLFPCFKELFSGKGHICCEDVKRVTVA